jgi:hypothetical protein
MIAQTSNWDEQVTAWIAADPVAQEYQRFFRLVALERGARTG